MFVQQFDIIYKMNSLWNVSPSAYLWACSLCLISFPPMWITRQTYIWRKRRPSTKGHGGPRASSNQPGIEGQIFCSIKRFADKRENDRGTFHLLRDGKVILALTWYNLNCMLTTVACFVAYWTSTVHLLWPPNTKMHLKNAFKSQNGVTMVQASKMELDGHCGCDFRPIPVLLRTWISWTVSDSGWHQLFSKQCLLTAVTLWS